MSPDIAFGCTHFRLEVLAGKNGTLRLVCKECTTTLAIWVGPIREVRA